MKRSDWLTLKAHILSDPPIEQFAFGRARFIETPDGPRILVENILIPRPEDVEQQSPTLVVGARPFVRSACEQSLGKGYSLFDAHGHPFQHLPRFSGIDDREGEMNARWILERFPTPQTLVMLVLGSTGDPFDARYFDRSLDRWVDIERIEVIGRPLQVLHRTPRGARTVEPQFDRPARLAPWNQPLIEDTRVTVVGAGGNGASVIQLLASLGVGLRGWIAIIDPDRVEVSNLPRIPFATAKDIGLPKVQVAAAYLRRSHPHLRVVPLMCPVQEARATGWLSASTVVIGCGDNDGVRHHVNLTAAASMVPYIDLGCDVTETDDGSVEMGAQVFTVIPGQTGCLACCHGYDPSAAAQALMTPEQWHERAMVGYTAGVAATPSIATLNTFTAAQGVQALLRLLLGAALGNADFVSGKMTRSSMVAASMPANKRCAVCGRGAPRNDGQTEHAPTGSVLVTQPALV